MDFWRIVMLMFFFFLMLIMGKLSDFWLWANRVAGFDLEDIIERKEKKYMEIYFYLRPKCKETPWGFGQLQTDPLWFQFRIITT
jgi:hypothetical protein